MGRRARLVWVRDDEATATILSLVGIDASAGVIASLTDDQERAACEWASAVHLRASDNIVRVPKRPDFIPEPWRGPERRNGDVFDGPTGTPLLPQIEPSNVLRREEG